MIYSNFNWDTGKYDYYEGMGENLGIRPKARKVVNAPKGRGAPIESLLPLIPKSSTFRGSGDIPKGRVGVLEGIEDNPLVTNPWLTMGLWVGTFFVGIKVARWMGEAAGKRYR